MATNYPTSCRGNKGNRKTKTTHDVVDNLRYNGVEFREGSKRTRSFEMSRTSRKFRNHGCSGTLLAHICIPYADLTYLF